MDKEWIKSKTVWGCILGILGTVGEIIRGDINLAIGIPVIFGFWTALGFRNALD